MLKIPTQRILVIRFGSLGDVVLIEPVLRSIRKAYPRAIIEHAVKEEYSGLFSKQGLINNERILGLRQRSIWGFLGYIRGLRRLGYDIVIDLHSNLRSKLIRLSLMRSRRVTYKKQWLIRRLMTTSGILKKIAFRISCHTLDSYMTVLMELDIEKVSDYPRFTPEDDDERWVSLRLSDWGPDMSRPLVGLAPGSKWATKRWPEERYAYLADRLMGDYNAQVLFLGGEDDIYTCHRIISLMKNKPLSAVGTTTPARSAAFMKRCSAMVTNDTGSMHLGCAVGIPVIAIFGSTTRELGFGPLGTDAVVLESDLDCRPCAVHGRDACPQKHLDCLKGIEVEDVLETTLKVIHKTKL